MDSARRPVARWNFVDPIIDPASPRRLNHVRANGKCSSDEYDNHQKSKQNLLHLQVPLLTSRFGLNDQ
jgi:hypothetical protein